MTNKSERDKQKWKIKAIFSISEVKIHVSARIPRKSVSKYTCIISINGKISEKPATKFLLKFTTPAINAFHLKIYVRWCYGTRNTNICPVVSTLILPLTSTASSSTYYYETSSLCITQRKFIMLNIVLAITDFYSTIPPLPFQNTECSTHKPFQIDYNKYP